MEQEDIVKGFEFGTVDILMEMFKKLGLKTTRKDIDVLPWPRGYKYNLEKPDTVLFSTTYTVERLQSFRFLGPIIPTQISIIAKKSRNLNVSTPDEMNKLKIGTITDDIGDQLIRAFGVEEGAIRRIHRYGRHLQYLPIHRSPQHMQKYSCGLVYRYHTCQLVEMCPYPRPLR